MDGEAKNVRFSAPTRNQPVTKRFEETVNIGMDYKEALTDELRKKGYIVIPNHYAGVSQMTVEPRWGLGSEITFQDGKEHSGDCSIVSAFRVSLKDSTGKAVYETPDNLVPSTKRVTISTDAKKWRDLSAAERKRLKSEMSDLLRETARHTLLNMGL
ncbi:hypothetical protein AAFN60_21165 [Roseibacillus persicicus]|uniref:hypothetical protein n=1 Tax=Roseibacillus persicicus TaxID=454148 RepID=UPI00398AD80B